MASPTAGTATNTYWHPPPDTSWTFTQGSANGFFGIFFRKSQWTDTDGTWGGENVGGVSGASVSGVGTAISGYVNQLVDPTTKSGDTRAVTSAWGDEMQFIEVPVTATGKTITVVDGGNYYSTSAPTGNKTITLDPGNNDCIAIIGCLIGNNGSGLGVPSFPAGTSSATSHLSGNVGWSHYARVYTAEWPASVGSDDITVNVSTGSKHVIMVAGLVGVQNAGPLRKYGFTGIAG